MPDLPDAKAHAHPHARSTNRRAASTKLGRRGRGYAELAVTTNFTFLRGASHPDEYVHQAALLGYHGVAVTDHNTLAGIVRGHVAAKEMGISFVVGCRLNFADPDGLSLLVYPTDRASYGRLCTLLTIGKRRAAKGECRLTIEDLLHHQEGLLGVVALAFAESDGVPPALRRIREAFDDDRLSVAVSRLYGSRDQSCVQRSRESAKHLGVPMVVINDVYYHVAERRPLQDVLTCVRHGCTIGEAGFRLFSNGERYLKPVEEMFRLWHDHPEALARTVQIAERASGFSLDQLRYEYAEETCPPGMTPMEHLKALTWAGAKERYPSGVPDKVRGQIEHEFALIEQLVYAPYFLTVHDLVAFARSQGILCQGRGAAANSAVCYCLGVTSVDPDRIDLLFERFVSVERNEPPDIDIDFEHERREEVIQYLYEKYGRNRAGLTAEVITYRRRSAIRDVGKALGFSLDAVDRIAKRVDSWERNPFADSEAGDVPAQLGALGFDRSDKTVQLFVQLVRELLGFPRHLSQHVGGFVITRGPLSEYVPIENAAMPNRTVIEWDKDDIDALGMLKVDVLGLGMLTCIRKALSLLNRQQGNEATRQQGTEARSGQYRDRQGAGLSADQEAARQRGNKATGQSDSVETNASVTSCLVASLPFCLSLATIPAEDPAVYDMLCKADSLGVFQVESRAQMTMLPRLKPRCFYDLVIEVAIVRPGPIVGEMVHPYLRRRNGEEPVSYPDETIRSVLGRTLGVPLYQEQVMALAIKAAGFTAGEAEKLRRAITAWTTKNDIAEFPARFVGGMVQNGYSREFAEWCFKRFQGFSQYGFPESHAASFALIVYASAWIKCYFPAVFAAALLNSQPLGFYAPAQIVRDAQEHSVGVRPVDVNRSEWDCTLEDGGAVLRLGLRMVDGLRRCDADAIIEAVKQHGPFTSIFDLWRASEVSSSPLHVLAAADAFGSMQLSRQQATWEVRSLKGKPLPLFDGVPEPRIAERKLPEIPLCDDVTRDYCSVGLSLKAHPVSFLRSALRSRRVITASEAKNERISPFGRLVSVAGIVLFRQRPGTAKGVMFMTLEDETARIDLIVRPDVYERFRDAAVYAKLVIARGRVERREGVVHLLCQAFEDIERFVENLPRLSRDFR